MRRANPYLYRGEQFDADLSAYYLRARYYQAATGRFLATIGWKDYLMSL